MTMWVEKILEEIKGSAKIGEMQAEMIKLETVEKIIRKHMNEGWIPVEERLPEERGKYLCTVECIGHRYVIVGHYNNPGWTDNYCGQMVIAWQPLPEPYRPQK